jgi:hypothetical protein
MSWLSTIAQGGQQTASYFDYWRSLTWWQEPVAMTASYNPDLYRLADWLKSCGVVTVAVCHHLSKLTFEPD